MGFQDMDTKFAELYIDDTINDNLSKIYNFENVESIQKDLIHE